MKPIVFTALFVASLALVPSHSAWAEGGRADSSSPFANKSDEDASQASETTFDSVIDELVSTIHEETEHHNQVMSDYDLQRMELVNDIANSPLASTPPIQNFLQQYDQATTREAREEAVYQLKKELYSELMKMIRLALENNSEEFYISTDFGDAYSAALKLARVEAELIHRAKLHAGSSCSGKQLEELRNGGGQQTSQPLPNCYETAQR